ncbi:hypothetical protein GCM10009846_28750 [Agrococcus versicolor]|uniref:Uncharacterized protein n=1 Tax=Agrococcus versicolor TaxID=501482 RepID=A0ABN3AZ29_9MICO
MTDIEAEGHVVDHVVQAITKAHPEIDASQVEGLAHEEYAKLEQNPVQDYVEVLTEHAVKQRLHDA